MTIHAEASDVDHMRSMWIDLQTEIYSLEAILRTCYWIMENFFVYVTRKSEDLYSVRLTEKIQGSLEKAEGEFLNNLLENELRVRIGAQTQSVRELLVSKALGQGADT